MIDESLKKILMSKNYAGQRYTSGRIVEYDISKCNISMLRKYGAIDNDSFTFLLGLPKFAREKEIGLMEIYNPKLYEIIDNGTVEAKLKLAELNNIQINEIVRIANDAIYVNRFTDLPYTKLDNFVEFKMKSICSVVLFITNNISIYYNRDNSNGQISLDIKGLGNNAILHQNHFSSFLATVITLLEYSSIEDCTKFITEFYNDYINKRLDINFYREFNPESMFSIKNSGYYLSQVDSLDLVDIKFNMNIIREIWGIILERVK